MRAPNSANNGDDLGKGRAFCARAQDILQDVVAGLNADLGLLDKVGLGLRPYLAADGHVTRLVCLDGFEKKTRTALLVIISDQGAVGLAKMGDPKHAGQSASFERIGTLGTTEGGPMNRAALKHFLTAEISKHAPSLV